MSFVFCRVVRPHSIAFSVRLATRLNAVRPPFVRTMAAMTPSKMKRLVVCCDGIVTIQTKFLIENILMTV